MNPKLSTIYPKSFLSALRARLADAAVTAAKRRQARSL